MTGHFCKKIYYFPLKFLAQYSETMSSFTGIPIITLSRSTGKIAQRYIQAWSQVSLIS